MAVFLLDMLNQTGVYLLSKCSVFHNCLIAFDLLQLNYDLSHSEFHFAQSIYNIIDFLHFNIEFEEILAIL